MCVTNFTCILLENHVYAAVSVSVSSNFCCKNYLSAGYFCKFVGSFETFLAICRVWYSKKPVSATKKDMIQQVRIWQQEFAGTNKPWKWLALTIGIYYYMPMALTLSYNISKSRKRRYITLNLILFRCRSNIGIASFFSLFFQGVWNSLILQLCFITLSIYMSWYATRRWLVHQDYKNGNRSSKWASKMRSTVKNLLISFVCHSYLFIIVSSITNIQFMNNL